jgi:hypothetical protein
MRKNKAHAYVLHLGASFVLMGVKAAHCRNHLPAFTGAIRPINHTSSYSTECIKINCNVKTDGYFPVYLQICVYTDIPVLNVVISTLQHVSVLSRFRLTSSILPQ